MSGVTPIVDVQSIRRQTTIGSEVLTSIPTARSWAATALLIPGIVTIGGSPADVQVTPQMTVFGGAGGRNNEGRMQVDGLNTGAGLGGSGVSTYVADISNAQEVVTTTSGGLGEAEVGGPTLSIIPKSGGNTIAGSAYLSGVGGGMVGSNYTDRLKGLGLTTPGSSSSSGISPTAWAARSSRIDCGIASPRAMKGSTARFLASSRTSTQLIQPSSCMRPTRRAKCVAPRAGASTPCASPPRRRARTRSTSTGTSSTQRVHLQPG